ncbi:MAG: hypothetical protein KGR26_03630, partial [Cyanobacteria bacterium REEB65]|nr:hypothetical protein [Cyanobacteria bacterium REEB65]
AGAGSGHWELVTESSSSLFIPAIQSLSSQTAASQQRNLVMSGEEGAGSQQARQAMTVVSDRLAATSRAEENTVASLASAQVDLAPLRDLLAAGARDFGGANRPLFRASLAAGKIVIRPYRKGQLLGADDAVTLSDGDSSAGNKDLAIAVRKVSTDGQTLQGQFDFPNGGATSVRVQTADLLWNHVDFEHREEDRDRDRR